ncbi:hypothetical protein AAJP84_06130 [Bartonella schoenbuchensis]|uniref:hypothetical protein n=1 Tax=Bartonella schoenbuchensis TaxID=165694 RepID=UPI0031CC5F0F
MGDGRGWCEQGGGQDCGVRLMRRGGFGKESLRECFGRKIGYAGGGVRARLWGGHVGEELKLEVCGECSG